MATYSNIYRGGMIAVEIEARVSKQVRGAVLFLDFPCPGIAQASILFALVSVKRQLPRSWRIKGDFQPGIFE